MSRRGGRRAAEYEDDIYRREPAREVLREPPPVQSRAREFEEIDIFQRRGPETNRPDFMREDYKKDNQGRMVLRERETETLARPVEKRSSSPVKTVRPRYVGRSPSPPPIVERERARVVGRERQRSPSLPPERVRARFIGERQRSPSPIQSVRTRYVEREREKSPSPPMEFRRMKIVERERERSPTPDRSQLRMRVIERVERAKEPSPEALPPPPPPQIYIEKPPIHQDIITHHRHIDHGFELAPALPPPAPAPAPRRREREREREETEIDVSTTRGQTKVDIYKNYKPSRHRNNDTLEVYDDDILFERERDSKLSRSKENQLSRRRSLSSRPWAESTSEADYYNRRAEERAYIGEAYNGATKDWSIVDVPPGTERVTMDGVGGGGQEITWQRYNGVRRSRFVPERESEREKDVERVTDLEVRERDRAGMTFEYEREEITDRRVGRPLERRRADDMWTEITKDLVVREAIEQMGYDFEETEFFYYIIQYLRYEDVLQLVELSEEIRRERQKRMRELQWERELLEVRREREFEERRKWERRERELARDAPYEDERIIEREIFYDGRRGVGRDYLR